MNDEYILFQLRRSVIVIPNLIWEPDEYTLKSSTLLHTTGPESSSGRQIKSGMTITECLTLKRMHYLQFIMHNA